MHKVTLAELANSPWLYKTAGHSRPQQVALRPASSQQERTAVFSLGDMRTPCEYRQEIALPGAMRIHGLTTVYRSVGVEVRRWGPTGRKRKSHGPRLVDGAVRQASPEALARIEAAAKAVEEAQEQWRQAMLAAWATGTPLTIQP